MATTRVFTDQIIGCERMQNTQSGTPRYRIVTGRGTYTTVRDGAVNYGIANSDFRDCDVVFTLIGGDITGISTLDGRATAGAPQ